MKRITFHFTTLFLITVYMRAQNCPLICNGSFDNQSLTTSVGLFTTVSCWSTTGSDGKMEIWASGFNNVPSFNGIQHCELNGTEAATMYQDFSVSSGMLLNIGFAHRGRAGIDTMEVSIGPVGGPYTWIGRYGDGTSAWGYYTSTYNTTSSGMHRIKFTPVYWSGGNIAIGNFLDGVSVTAAPNLIISISSATVCAGNTVALTASGANSYTWTGGPSAASYTVSPAATTVYTVTGVSSGTCSGIKTVTVNVLPAPVIKATASKTLTCYFTPATITASGGVSYVWSNGPTTPTINTNSTIGLQGFTVTGTGANGCKSTATVQVQVVVCEGIADRELNAAVSIFPNPSNGSLHVITLEDAKIFVYNAAGQLLRTLVLNESNSRGICISDLPTGVYIIKGEGSSSFTKRIAVTER